jgi:aminoglycoside phosphotransferase (APT) family kinase protein
MEGGETDLSARLLDFLCQRLGNSALTYAARPIEFKGGFESRVYSFVLAGAPPAFEGPLVLRVLRRVEDPERARREAVVHNTVAEHGFPAPRVLIAVTTPEELDAPFLIMQRAPGATMLAQFEGLGRGRPSGELVRVLIGMARILRETISRLAQTQARLHRLPGDLLLRAFEREGLTVGAITFDGKLQGMFDKTGPGPLSDLRPAVAWLIDNRPSQPDALVICHGDFQPFNIMVKDGQVTGVIDWVNATVAERALDVGFTVGSFVTVPVPIPLILRQLVYASMRAGRRAYAREYRRLAPLPAPRVRYYEAARCVSELVWMGTRLVSGDAKTGVYQSAEGVQRLKRHLRRLTGVDVRFPFEV